MLLVCHMRKQTPDTHTNRKLYKAEATGNHLVLDFSTIVDFELSV